MDRELADGEMAIVTLARVEQVTGVPEVVPIVAGVIILVWAFLKIGSGRGRGRRL